MQRSFYEAKAEECELLAEELHDPELRREWLEMADDWRLAAIVLPSPRLEGAPDIWV